MFSVFKVCIYHPGVFYFQFQFCIKTPISSHPVYTSNSYEMFVLFCADYIFHLKSSHHQVEVFENGICNKNRTLIKILK
jgi:hypothetical protein